MGILGILAGMIVLRHPVYATVFVGNVLIIVLASVGLLMGIVGLIRAFTGAGWGPGILGALSILIAIFLFANLWIAIALPIILGVCMVIGGIVAIFFSFRVRSALA
jgi:uncharacterized membrane protein HdeD (DUF308 family)